LLFRQAVPDAAVYARGKGEMAPWLGPLDIELTRRVYCLFIPIARDILRHHAVALGDGLAGNFCLYQRGAAHVDGGELIANNFRRQGFYQAMISPQGGELLRIVAQRQRLPVMALGVVSSPPTISRTKVEMRSPVLRFFVASSCTIMETRSKPGSPLLRSSHKVAK